MAKNEDQAPEPYVITDGDEGVQINTGTRFAFAGCGYELPGFSEAVKVLQKLLKKDIRIAINQENDWFKARLDLKDWDDINATAQQQIESIAKQEGLLYSNIIPFADPRKLKNGIKGHMVRPKGVHVGNKICFSLGGGEQVYNLGCYRIAADWVSEVPKKLAEESIAIQIDHYHQVSGVKKMKMFYELGGELGEKIAEKNLKVLEKMGLDLEKLPKRG
jgi:hypothetical protein